MEKSDYSHLDLLSNGTIVKEEYELVQLADCCLYVLPSNTHLDAEAVGNCLTSLTRWEHMFINRYDMEALDELPCMCNHPQLEMAFKKDDYNLIMSLNEPGLSEGKKYLMVKTGKNVMDKDIALMLSVSEAVTRQSVLDLMLKHAIFAPNAFFRFTERNWVDESFWRSYVEKRIKIELHGCRFAYPPSYESLRKRLGLDKILTHQKKLEMQEDFIKNLKALQADEKDEIAKAKVQVVLECLDIKNHEVLSYLKAMPEDFIQQFCNKVIPKKIAEVSNLKMEVRWFQNSDIHRPTDGHYRLFLHKDEEVQQVFFKRKPSFVLYLLFLLDIYNSERVDTLNIKDNYSESYSNLYNKVYYYGGADSFKNMFGKNSSKQDMLKLYLSDIRISIGNACEKLHEAASPYILDDINSHLCILKRNLIIDKRLIMPMTA